MEDFEGPKPDLMKHLYLESMMNFESQLQTAKAGKKQAAGAHNASIGCNFSQNTGKGHFLKNNPHLPVVGINFANNSAGNYTALKTSEQTDFPYIMKKKRKSAQ